MSVATPKGKGKANEREPLLEEDGCPADENHLGIQSQQEVRNPSISTPSQMVVRRAWRSHLLTVALAILTVFFGLLLGIILLADSYAAPAWHNVSKALSHSRSGDKFWKQAVLVHGPDTVAVNGINSQQEELGMVHLGINMSITMRIAVDTDFIMGFREADNQDDSWWRKKWKALGRWGVRRLGNTTAVVDNIIVYPSPSDDSDPLVTFKPLSPIAIPLRPGLSIRGYDDPSFPLEPVSIPLMIYPSQNASLIFQFFKQSWTQGFVDVRIHASKLVVQGGDKYRDHPKWWDISRWRNWIKFDKEEVTLDLTLPIPPLHWPGNPGSGVPKLSELLTLESFNITSAPAFPAPPRPLPSQASYLPDLVRTDVGVESDQNMVDRQKVLDASIDVSPSSRHVPIAWNILLFARASLAHPFPKLVPKLDLGRGLPPLPFIVSLPISHDEDNAFNFAGQGRNENPIPVAKVYASPGFNTTHIRILLSGYVLPLSNSSDRLPGAISAFVSSYLSYKPSSISISSPLYPALEVHALFPPPSHRLELLKDVEIENMSIYPSIGSLYLPNPNRNASSLALEDSFRTLQILASATIHARVVLPPGMEINIQVVRVWVDCFVFDGEVPSDVLPLHVKRTSNPSATTVSTIPEMEDPPLPEPRPLPTPLPLRAFARLTPTSWLNATSSRLPHERPVANDHFQSEENTRDTGTNILVTAQLVDVPLQVLPGRQGDLSRFVTKVLFSTEPVVAGIRGVAAVGVTIPGLTTPASSLSRIEGGELILKGLPFEGNVRVGGHGL